MRGQRRSGFDRGGIVEQHRFDGWIVEDGAAIQQETETLRKRGRPRVHLQKPIDWRLSFDRRADIEAVVEDGADLIDGMELEGADEVGGGVHRSWALIDPRRPTDSLKYVSQLLRMRSSLANSSLDSRVCATT